MNIFLCSYLNVPCYGNPDKAAQDLQSQVLFADHVYCSALNIFCDELYRLQLRTVHIVRTCIFDKHCALIAMPLKGKNVLQSLSPLLPPLAFMFGMLPRNKKCTYYCDSYLSPP